MTHPEVLGIIPARAGSKGIPGKNLLDLAGKPLLAYTALAAQASQRLTRRILSTDGAEIARVGQGCGLEVPFHRPAELAGDDTPTLTVVQHALAWLHAAEGYRPDLVVLLQPTSPLRPAHRIDEAVDLLLSTGADSVVSLCPVEHPVAWLRRLGPGGRVQPFLVAGDGPARRQDAEPLYRLNGAVYATRTAVIEGGTLLGPDTRGLVMTPEESVDIDTPLDVVIALGLLQQPAKGGGNP